MNLIEGKVIKGSGLGKKLGFPTLNIAYDGGKNGVFVAKVFVNGKWKDSAVFIGKKLADEKTGLEAYIIDLDSDVELGAEIKVELLKKIREVEKFDSLKKLKAQIAKDVFFVKEWYNRS
jgi:riboflavin kinase/FMN adenylyltransferase